MRRKHITHVKFKLITTIMLVVLLIILVVICAGKIKLAQNQKNIIGTWENSNSEVVITVKDTETLVIDKDMPDASLYCGSASYYFVYTDTICVSQGNATVDFEIDFDSNKLVVYFMGQKYLVLHKR